MRHVHDVQCESMVSDYNNLFCDHNRPIWTSKVMQDML